MLTVAVALFKGLDRGIRVLAGINDAKVLLELNPVYLRNLARTVGLADGVEAFNFYSAFAYAFVFLKQGIHAGVVRSGAFESKNDANRCFTFLDAITAQHIDRAVRNGIAQILGKIPAGVFMAANVVAGNYNDGQESKIQPCKRIVFLLAGVRVACIGLFLHVRKMDKGCVNGASVGNQQFAWSQQA